MAETAAKRSMDDFLINPMMPALESNDYYIHSRTSTAAFDFFPAMPYTGIQNMKSVKTSEPSGAVRESRNEPFFSRGYTSDEELASPIDNDDMSMHTGSSEYETASISEASIHDARSHVNAQQLCTQAQAVQLVSAGKAKVVSMPKISDVSVTPRSLPSPASPSSPVSRMNTGSTGHSRNSSVEQSPPSSGPRFGTPGLTSEKSLRRKPNLPRLQMTARTEPPQAFDFPPKTSRPDFLNHDPFPTNQSPPSSAALPSPAKRTMHRLSSSFSLRGFGRRSSVSESRLSSELEPVKEPERTIVSPVVPEFQLPVRTSSRPEKPKPKLVPRGANERAPTIKLPPCPDDYDDDERIITTQWPPRKESVATIIGPSIDARARTPAAHYRRKSLGATLVTSQA